MGKTIFPELKYTKLKIQPKKERKNEKCTRKRKNVLEK